MAGKQDKISNTCPESCLLYSHSIAKVLLYVFVREPLDHLIEDLSVLPYFCHAVIVGPGLDVIK